MNEIQDVAARVLADRVKELDAAVQRIRNRVAYPGGMTTINAALAGLDPDLSGAIQAVLIAGIGYDEASKRGSDA